jgi:hypothetical protein
VTAASQRDPGAVMRCITDAVGHFDETLVGTYVMLVVERRATARPGAPAIGICRHAVRVDTCPRPPAEMRIQARSAAVFVTI